MRKLFAAAIAVALLALGGCQAVQKTIATIGTVATLNVSNPVTPQRVYELRLAYDAIVPVATAYIRLPLCSEKHPTICSHAEVSARIKALAPQARAAINRLTAFSEQHPTLDASALYDVASQAVAAFRGATPQP